MFKDLLNKSNEKEYVDSLLGGNMIQMSDQRFLIMLSLSRVSCNT